MADVREHDTHKDAPGRSLVAVFQSQAEARSAIAALHKAHMTHTWLGSTSVAESDRGEEKLTVESAQGFFSQTSSLVDALVTRGVLGDTAREIETSIEPGDAVLTLDPKDKDVEEGRAIIERHGGRTSGFGSRDGSLVRASTLDRGTTGLVTPSSDLTWEEETFYRRG